MSASSGRRLPPAENGWISGTFWLVLADAATDLRALANAMPHVNLMASHQRRAAMWRIEARDALHESTPDVLARA